MGFREDKINFKDNSIHFVNPINEKFKDAVGATIGTAESVYTTSQSSTDQDFVLGKDIIDVGLNRAIGKATYNAGKSRAKARRNNKSVKGFRKEGKKIDGHIKNAKSKLTVSKSNYNESCIALDNAKENYKNAESPAEIKEAKKKIDEAKASNNEAKAQMQTAEINVKNLQDRKDAAGKKKGEAKNQKKENKKEASKNDRKAAALKTILAAKGELNGENQSPDNLIESGKSGLMGAVLNAINPIEYLKQRLMQYLMSLISSMLTTIMSFLMPVLSIMLIILVVIWGVYGVFSTIVGNFSSGGGIEYSSYLDYETIEELILERGWEWQYDYDENGRIDSSARRVSTLPQEQQDLLYYVFSKVGAPYSQDYRMSGSYYDCSSLAYFTEAAVGKDIGSGTAASQAKSLHNSGKMISQDSGMEIGDLIYYGGHDNGRYLGIYHVAIYVGNGYCVEAFSTGKGVIYTPARSKNVVMVCRP